MEVAKIFCSSQLWVYPSERFSNKKKFRLGLDWMIVVCYFCDVMWMTGYPAFTPVNIREELALQEEGKVILINDYEGSWI